MIIDFHRQFEKKISKLPKIVEQKFYERLQLFEENYFHPLLNNHALSGKLKGSRSINVTGNYRAIFTISNDREVLFYDIDTHPKLYRS